MITAFWWAVDRAVKTTITQRIKTEVRGIRFFYKSGMLFIKIGRSPDWIPDILLRADGYETNFYKKD